MIAVYYRDGQCRRWERAYYWNVTSDGYLELSAKTDELLVVVAPGVWETAVDVDLAEGPWPAAPHQDKIGIEENE